MRARRQLHAHRSACGEAVARPLDAQGRRPGATGRAGWLSTAAARVNEPCSRTAAKSCNRRASMPRPYTYRQIWHLTHGGRSRNLSRCPRLTSKPPPCLTGSPHQTAGTRLSTSPPATGSTNPVASSCGRLPWPADDPALLAPRPAADVADLLIPGDPASPGSRFHLPRPSSRSLVAVAAPGRVRRWSGRRHRRGVPGARHRRALHGGLGRVPVGPEAPFPAALDDVETALMWIVAHAPRLGSRPTGSRSAARARARRSPRVSRCVCAMRAASHHCYRCSPTPPLTQRSPPRLTSRTTAPCSPPPASRGLGPLPGRQARRPAAPCRSALRRKPCRRGPRAPARRRPRPGP